MNVLHATMFAAAMAAATPAPVAKDIPQEVCQSAVHILRDSDAMCVLTGSNVGARSRLYKCFDKHGDTFLVERTAGDKA